MSAAQAEVFRRIEAGPRGTVAGPLRVWMQNPDMADKAQDLGQYVRYDSVLPPRLTELAILVTARIWSSGFEWSHHAPIAVSAGVPAEAVDAISRVQRFDFDDASMQAVFDFAVELHRDRKVSDAAYSAAIAEIGENGCIDLVALCGYYTLISMTINVFDVPSGGGPELPRLDAPVSDYFRA